jgi:hypothetical protein
MEWGDALVVIDRKSAKGEFVIRPAGFADAAVIARHRARMFHDTGEISAAAFDGFQNAARLWLERALASGEYIGWLGVPKDEPDQVVGGAGVQLRSVPAHPSRSPKDGGFAQCFYGS